MPISTLQFATSEEIKFASSNPFTYLEPTELKIEVLTKNLVHLI